MDLRGRPLPVNLEQRLQHDGANGVMWYQPVIFRDDLLVGTGGLWSSVQEVDSYVCTTLTEPKIKQRMLDENLRLMRWYQRLAEAFSACFPAPRRVIDVGCNVGWFCFEMARRGYQATGVDMWRECYELVRDVSGVEFEYIQGRYDSKKHCVPQLEGRTFDIAVVSAISTHLTDPHYFLASMRALAPQGAIVTTPLTSSGPEEVIWRLRVPDWRAERELPDLIEFLPSRAAMELVLQSLWPYVYSMPVRDYEPKAVRLGWGAWIGSATPIDEALLKTFGLEATPSRRALVTDKPLKFKTMPCSIVS